MLSMLLTIAAVIAGLSILAAFILLAARRLRLFRTEKATMQIRALSDSGIAGEPQRPAQKAGVDAQPPAEPQLRETSVPAWASRVVVLNKASITIGRAIHNDIILTEEAASAEHCRIERQGPSFRLIDLGSTNKTWLNGHQTQETILSHGDQIRVGQTAFVFEWAGDRS